MLKAVIFDLDGTLTNSDKVHFQVFQRLFAERGISLDRALYRQKVSGRQNAAILADFLPDLSETEVEAFSADKEAAFRDAAKGNLTPLAGLPELLAQLESQELPVAVVTNAPPENADFMLKELGLSDTFSPVVISEELPRGKPDPLPYQTALDKLSIAAEEAIAFEDSAAGIRSAVGAGIKTIGVMTTHSEAELIDAGANGVIADFTDDSVQHLMKR